ncbi:uncharacterized protein LOC124917765, partial [Impatiens glandulifera]|uniref:uncharacterized protein LOC124917765 n=1 Tax=Impatiens glandulifera TaxID=253017 RepID=UPI001FB175D2
MALLVPSAESSPVFRRRRLELLSKRPFSTISKSVRFHRILTTDARLKLPIGASLRLQDLQVRDSGSGNEIADYVQFSAPINPSVISPTKQKEEEEERQNYYVNTGYAIRTLREECPQLFY